MGKQTAQAKKVYSSLSYLKKLPIRLALRVFRVGRDRPSTFVCGSNKPVNASLQFVPVILQ